MKTRGFTLVELLGVIVILSLLMLVVLPKITNSTRSSSSKTDKLTEDLIYKATSLYISENEGTYLSLNGVNYCISLSELVDKDYLKSPIKFSDNNDITSSKVVEANYNNGYVFQLKENTDCVSKEIYTNGIMTSTDSCIIEGTCTNGTLINVKVNNNKDYNFYVINDDGSEITLIMDRNLGDTTAWISQTDYTAAGGTSWSGNGVNKGPLTALKTLKERTDSWTNIEEYSYKLTDDGGGTRYQPFDVNNVRARMLTQTEAKELGCQYKKNNSCPSYLYGNLGGEKPQGYWLSGAFFNVETLANRIDYNGAYQESSTADTEDRDGIRPVIKIKKLKPKLIEGLTPVKYKNNNWVVVNENKIGWYNYNKQEWANAVILNSGVTKNVGDIVNISSEVKAMLVWIPRYEYKIEGNYGKGGTSASSPGEIEVNFISRTQTTASSGYRIHPAFTFGNEELEGIWVGKFETTGTEASPTILPNKESLRGQTVSKEFETAQKFNSYITNGDSHMAKNSEWGAVAYLSQSKYGKYGNTKYSGANKEIMINNCSSFITGIGANSQNEAGSTTTCTTNTYNTSKGQTASTTGNITGIYDMSGGAWEYVMGVYRGSGTGSIWGATSSNNYAGFTSAPNSKYYEIYTSTNLTTACNGGICYGQALSETNEWYGGYARFIELDNPWLLRGGLNINTDKASVFSNANYNGNVSINFSFRIVLSPTTN